MRRAGKLISAWKSRRNHIFRPPQCRLNLSHLEGAEVAQTKSPLVMPAIFRAVGSTTAPLT
eukprot:502860-Pleurochrysis_carterae.AAC.1